MWLGLALVFLRFLTTGQRSLFHNLIGGGNANPAPAGLTPSQQFHQQLQANANAAKGVANRLPPNPPQHMGGHPVSNIKPLGPPGISVVLWLLKQNQ